MRVCGVVHARSQLFAKKTNLSTGAAFACGTKYHKEEGRKMKTEVVRLRVSGEDLEELDKAAKRDGVSRSALLRTFMHEGLSSYDAKHQQLLGKVNQLERKVGQLYEMTSVISVLTSSAKGLNFSEFAPYLNGATQLVKEAQEIVNRKTKK